MSKATELTLAVDPATPNAPSPASKGGYRQLTDIQKRAIIAQLSAGAYVTHLAKRYGVNPSTIWRVRKAFVDATPDTPLEKGWRDRLHDDLPTKSVNAIERSLDDTTEPHKAAATGVNVLKGLGHLQGDTNLNVTVQAMIANIPPEYRDDLVLSIESTPTLPQDVVMTHVIETPAGRVDT